MAARECLICRCDQLSEAGAGFRFVVQQGGRQRPAFVVRFQGQVYAYLNECAHVPVELDWLPGEFFDGSRLHLICSVHGALYCPKTGICLSGRCQGRGLRPLPVYEAAGSVWLSLVS